MEHVCDFSKNKKYFAAITEDGKLRVWNTETNELRCDYAPNLQISAPCTCLVWVIDQTKKNRKNDPNREYIALGTRRGSVSMFSLSSGQIEFTLKGAGHSGAVTGICYNDENMLYTCGEDCKIISWNLSSGSQTTGGWELTNERPTAIALSADKQKLITASRQIKVWSAKTHECKQTFTGHTTSVQFLKVFQFEDSEFLISGSKMNRVLSMWNLRATTKKKDSMASFSLEDVPLNLDVFSVEGNLSLMVVCRNNTVYNFKEHIEDVVAKVKPIKSKLQMNLVSETKDAATKTYEPIPVLGGVMVENDRVTIGFGSLSFLKFETVTLEVDKKTQVLIRADPRKVHIKKGSADPYLGQLKPIVNTNQVEYSMIGSTKKHVKPNEIQIEKRLENLSMAKTGDGDKVVPGTNMTQLLIQGLHSNDSAILRQVFSITDVQSIRSTLQKLPPQYLGSMINELTSLMQQKIEHVETSTCWLKILVQTHASQLMALGADDLLSRFGPCLGIIEHRVTNLQSLARVRGRLELLLNQMKDNQRDDIIEMTNENLLVYQDDESESDSDLGQFNSDGSSSDDQWDEDDDQDDGNEEMNGKSSESMDEDVGANGMDVSEEDSST